MSATHSGRTSGPYFRHLLLSVRRRSMTRSKSWAMSAGSPFASVFSTAPPGVARGRGAGAGPARARCIFGGMPIRGARVLCAAVLAALAACAPARALAGADDPDSTGMGPARPAAPSAVVPPSTPDASRSGESPGGDAPPNAPEERGAPGTDLALTPPSTRGDIPWASLGSADYRPVRDVVDRAAVSREVNDIAFRSRKPVFDFLIAHLDFASDVARALRQGKYRVRRAGDAYEAEDGYGARGTLRPVLSEGDRYVFYLAGSYDAPLLPALEVRGVLRVEAEHSEGIDGVTYCSLHLAGHVRFDSRLVTTLA